MSGKGRRACDGAPCGSGLTGVAGVDGGRGRIRLLVDRVADRAAAMGERGARGHGITAPCTVLPALILTGEQGAVDRVLDRPGLERDEAARGRRGGRGGYGGRGRRARRRGVGLTGGA